jgi:hypothetical protein
MAGTTSDRHQSGVQLILIPSVITLVVTALRLVGELRHWSPVLFNPAAGGIGSLIGITWLAPIFGAYFALTLTKQGDGPTRPGRAVVHGVLGLVAIVLGSVLAAVFRVGYYGQLVTFCVVFAVAAAIQYPAWPTLFKTLLAYAYAARIPVAVLMFFAMRGNWGTHYDAVPPDSPPTINAFWPKYFWLAFLPQMIAWVGFTVWIGSLFGSITSAVVRRRKPAEQTA